MRTLMYLLILFSLTIATTSKASELEFFSGANSTTYDGASDANAGGISLRLQYNFSSETSGWIINLNAPGISLIAGQLSIGYLWRSHDSFYWEGGLAAGDSLIYGTFANVIGGFGYRVTKRFFFDFPIDLGSSGLTFLPYFGFEF